MDWQPKPATQYWVEIQRVEDSNFEISAQMRLNGDLKVDAMVYFMACGLDAKKESPSGLRRDIRQQNSEMRSKNWSMILMKRSWGKINFTDSTLTLYEGYRVIQVYQVITCHSDSGRKNLPSIKFSNSRRYLYLRYWYGVATDEKAIFPCATHTWAIVPALVIPVS